MAASLVMSAPASASPSRALSVTTKRIARGLTYQRYVDTTTPLVYHVLTLDPTRAPSLDTVTAGRIGAWARTSTMGSDAGALAAISGDFSSWPGFPMHPFSEEGSLAFSGLQTGSSFGIRQDETASDIRHQDPVVTARRGATGASVGVTAWNGGRPSGGSVVGFTPYGGDDRTPPPNACGIRLTRPSALHWGRRGLGVFRTYRARAAVCGSTALTVPDDGVVLSANTSGAGASWMRGIAKGERVRISWNIGMRGTLDTVGGMPMLLRGGVLQVSATCKTWFCQRNPRSAVGVTATGQVLLVVVDGRKTTSPGISLYNFAKLMQSLGAVDALNLDGGGSATMWVKGMGVVSDPSDSSGERPITNALVVLGGTDTHDPVPLRFARARSGRSPVVAPEPSFGEPGGALLGRAALTDPGSTGGLMDWLVRSTDPAMRSLLPPSVRRAAAAFRAAR